MRTIFKYTTLFYIIVLMKFLAHADTLNITRLISTPKINSQICGVGAEGIADQLVFESDSNGVHTRSYYSPAVLDITKHMRLTTFRFPGGTLGNFYHFYKHGYGVDTSETECAPGRIANSFASAYSPSTYLSPRNYIYDFNEQLQALKNDGNDVGVYYMLNINTHFYKHDISKYNTEVYNKLLFYANNNPILQTNGDAVMDSTYTSAWVNFLNLVLTDTFFIRMKYEISHDSTFLYRFEENLNAIRYLRSQNIKILGAEFGNESFADYRLFDDDLTDIDYDCTNFPPGFYISPYTALIKTYLKGLIKYKILASIYSDTLRSMHIKFGLPYATSYSYLTYHVDTDSILFIDPYTNVRQKCDLWNAFFKSQANLADAAIPHIYFQHIADCDYYTNETQKPALNKLLLRFYDRYADFVLPKMINQCVQNSGKKEIWITEWNYDGNSYSTNTMLAGYFIRSVLTSYEKIQNEDSSLHLAANYHSYANGYQGFVLIRTSRQANTLLANRQMVCFPFEMYSSTIGKGVHKLNQLHNIHLNLSGKVTDAYFSPEYKTLDLLYAHPDSATDYILLKNKAFIIDNIEYEVKRTKRFVLAASSLTSSDLSVCPTVQHENNTYRVLYDSADIFVDSLPIPAISVGKFTLQLTPKISTYLLTAKEQVFKIYPNPAEDILHIEMPETNVGACSYKILGTDGKVFQEGMILNKNAIVSIINLPQGLFVLQFINKDKVIDNQKFIKLN